MKMLKMEIKPTLPKALKSFDSSLGSTSVPDCTGTQEDVRPPADETFPILPAVKVAVY
jgi:hypothetical protein